MPDIGHDKPLQFPQNAVLLGDLGYQNKYPIMTPFRRPEIARANAERPDMLRVNAVIRRHRVYVEHFIARMKTYTVLSQVYRHPRATQASIVELCASLAQRRCTFYSQW